MFHVPQLVPLINDPAYMEWHPECKLRMQSYDTEDGTHELVLQRDPLQKIESAWMYLTDDKEYRTRDLFTPHPSNPKLWKFYGRTEDIIVLSNSAKFNPTPLESAVSAHLSVQGALAVGQGSPQAVLLIEPTHHVTQTPASKLIESVWPAIHLGNPLVPAHGTIMRSHVLVATPAKPFIRVPKGSVVRRATEHDRIPEPQVLQRDFKHGLTIAGLNQLLRDLLAHILPSMTDIDLDNDLFILDLDSLKTNELIRALQSSLIKVVRPTERALLDARMVYAHPSLNILVSAILQKTKQENL